MHKYLLTACLVVLPLTVNAALIDRGNGLIYDEDADLTWLTDANTGAGSVFDDGLSTTDGRMSWANANAWAADLNFNGITGWRLPTQAIPDATCNHIDGDVPYGSNCTGSEMGNLFYNVLGGVANTSIHTTHNDNYNLFSGIQTNYWSSTEHWSDPDNQAGSFNFDLGLQNFTGKQLHWYAWAVQDGDVGAVPIPAAVWLFGSGLIGLIGLTRRKA